MPSQSERELAATKKAVPGHFGVALTPAQETGGLRSMDNDPAQKAGHFHPMRKTTLSLFARSSALALTLGLAATGFAQNPLDDTSGDQPPRPGLSTAASRALKAKELTFLLNATQASLTEMEIGRLAAAKSSHNEIKAVGEMLAEDHAKTNSRLQALAERRGVNVPAQLPAENATVVEDLQNTTAGPGFDNRVVGQLVKDQRRNVSEFEAAASTVQDPEVREFAAKTLPTLKAQLEKIEEILRSL